MRGSAVHWAMARPILEESRLHPDIRERISGFHADVIREVEEAVAGTAVVVVGMRQNPYPKKARRILDAAGIRYAYLEYGSYLSQWRRRSALKMWAGWPTLPMIFVKGIFIGGADDLERLQASGELSRMLG